ncbi:MAG: Flp pilus assembly protein CpaB [Actinobacteria bacterium]|nr:Flp pilus assembly protein CpaB [Actinomycetota bacterium]
MGALVVGAVAALLIFRYVGGIEERAQGETQMVSVVIAKAQIPRGADANALIDSGQIAIGSRRRIDVPANAVTRVEDIRGQLAALDLTAGTIISTPMFVSNTQLSDSTASVLREGMVAVTISADQVHGVAGLITQGDYVNMAAAPTADQPTTGTKAAQQGTGCAGHLYQKVRVLALGRSLGSPVAAAPVQPGETPTTTQAPTSDLITFEVPPEASQQIIAVPTGKIYLTLVRPDYEPKPIAPSLDPLELLGAAGKTPEPVAAAPTAGGQ